MSTPTPHRRQFPFLDFVRAAAALLVMLGHARGQFMPEFASVQAAGPATRAFYLLTGLQHEAVVLFFLVSGFLVGGSAWAAMANCRFSWLRYLGNRFVRIYLVLVPGLLLTLAIHAVGITWLGDTASFAALPTQPWSGAVSICHLACLQGIFCSVLVANAPLWSLSYEWLLYLTAPLVLGSVYVPLLARWRVAALLLLAATLVTVLPAHLQWSWVGTWALGAIAGRAAALLPMPLLFGAAGLVVTVAAMAISRLHVLPSLASDSAIAIGFAVALASPSILAWSPVPRIFGRLADSSYSLYVIHLPIVIVVAALMERLIGKSQLEFGFETLAQFAVTAIIAVAAAIAFAHLTERHTRRLQHALVSSVATPAGVSQVRRA